MTFFLNSRARYFRKMIILFAGLVGLLWRHIMRGFNEHKNLRLVTNTDFSYCVFLGSLEPEKEVVRMVSQEDKPKAEVIAT
jgi:hypothetical protein